MLQATAAESHSMRSSAVAAGAVPLLCNVLKEGTQEGHPHNLRRSPPPRRIPARMMQFRNDQANADPCMPLFNMRQLSCEWLVNLSVFYTALKRCSHIAFASWASLCCAHRWCPSSVQSKIYT